MSLNTQAYKGARDFYPSDKRIQNYIFEVWRKTAISFGYEEYDAPIIEPIELYLAKTSEEIVNEQAYIFEDRGGRKVTLRPEMTPSVSRMVAAKRQELAYPLRWFSIPNLWRYERPQRGRLREHWQLNVDLFGVAGITADHEIILLADTVMQNFGADRSMYSIRLNSRKLVNFILNDYLQLTLEQAKSTIRLIDRMHKMSEPEFKGVINELIGSKSEELLVILKAQNLEDLPSQMQQHQSFGELQQLKQLLGLNEISNANFDISLMRGFDYYTDIVFEMFDTDVNNSRSIFGGGRYDGLVGLFGVEPVPTVGFGMGDVTVHDFLQSHNLLPNIPTNVQLMVVCLGDTYSKAQNLINELRKNGLSVAVDSTGRKLDKIIKNAVKSGVTFSLFVGDQEINDSLYNLKNLKSGTEQRLSIDDIVKNIKNYVT